MTSDAIARLIADFNDLKEKCAHQVEENQNLKQKNQNLQQEIQILKEKLQEKDKQLELQKSENQYEKLEQNIKNLEKQKSELLQQLDQLEIISQNIRNSLGIKNLNKVNDNKVQEKCLGKNTEKSGIYSDIQVVVGLDFGSASYARSLHKVGKQGIFRSNSYQQDNKILKQNVYKTLCCDTQFSNYLKIVELYKLRLGNLSDSNSKSNSYLYEYDLLRNIGKSTKDIIARSYPNIKYFENVLFVLTVSEEYSEKDEAIMRERVHNAKLVRNKSSEKIQFITESEAAATYCIKNELQKYNLLSTEEPFIIVDCGESTIDITTHKLVKNNPLQLSEITNRVRDFCGSIFIDKEIITFLHEKYGIDPLLILSTNGYYFELQNIYNICQHLKKTFAVDNTEFYYTLDVEENFPFLPRSVSKETREIMEEINWFIDIKYNDIKKMFDTVIDRIIRLIHIQLSNNKETCSAMFLVGGFGENKYLQRRIKQEFHHTVKIISTTEHLSTAISRGATDYGISLINSNSNKSGNKNIISTILKHTYGFRFASNWKEDNRKTSDGKISNFISLVERGTKVSPDQIFTFNFKPESGQTHAKFEVYCTNEESATYVDEVDGPGMKLLEVLNADLPDANLDNRSINFGLSFGPNKITAFASNELNGQRFEIKFNY
ncbi:16734_t:CDS:2 [Rhizophagus irregularis]|nr:16734_t:CDS:2 [Rhizophagus irregularis]